MKRAAIIPLLFLTLMIGGASASAHEFLASSTGKVTVKLLTTSRFTSISGTVECAGASLVAGEVTTLKSASITATTQFEKCKAFGLNATVSPVRVRSTAEGNVSLLASVSVKAVACEVKFPSSKIQNLASIKYVNTSKGVEKVATVSGITSSGVGAACSFEEENRGLFKGDALVGLIGGGTLDWK